MLATTGAGVGPDSADDRGGAAVAVYRRAVDISVVAQRPGAVLDKVLDVPVVGNDRRWGWSRLHRKTVWRANCGEDHRDSTVVGHERRCVHAATSCSSLGCASCAEIHQVSRVARWLELILISMF